MPERVPGRVLLRNKRALPHGGLARDTPAVPYDCEKILVKR